MHLVAFIIIIALIEYFVFGFLVGQARGRTGVAAPAISGHPEFDRYMRAHQNTMEQLVIFIPSVWLFAVYISPRIAALLGLLFVIGRAVYFRGYIEEAGKRQTGFFMTALAQIILMVGAGLGALAAWL